MIKVARDYSTPEAARLLGFSSNTVAKWCDGGLLKHYRVPGKSPNSPRRITAKALRAFVREHGLPMPPELEN